MRHRLTAGRATLVADHIRYPPLRVTGIEYRSLTDRDFPGVHRVALESWRSAYRGLMDEERIEATVSDHYSAERLRQVLDKVTAGSRYFEVAVRDAQVLGFCTIVFTSLGAELSRLSPRSTRPGLHCPQAAPTR